MIKARLNYAYGVKKPRLKRSRMPVHSKKLFGQVRGFFSEHFRCKPSDLRFAQNVTTHVVQVVRGIKKRHPDVQVFVDSHEVPWIKTTFETGTTHPDMTRPNYASLRHKKIGPTKVQLFDPKKLLSNLPGLLSNGKSAVIVLSHVSRVTGETFPVREIFARMKELSPNSVLIVDGAQVAGAMKVDVRNACDVYISVTSKFLGAEPNLAVAYLSPGIRSRFLGTYPKLNPAEFAREAHSAVKALSQPMYAKAFEERIKSLRDFALGKLKRVKGVAIRGLKGQAPHIITLKVGNRERTKQIVAQLKKRGVDVFHNMDWSIAEPRVPLLRVSIGAKTSFKEIESFVRELSGIVNTRT